MFAVGKELADVMVAFVAAFVHRGQLYGFTSGGRHAPESARPAEDNHSGVTPARERRRTRGEIAKRLDGSCGDVHRLNLRPADEGDFLSIRRPRWPLCIF